MNRIDAIILDRLSATVQDMTVLGCPKEWQENLKLAIAVIEGKIDAIEDWRAKYEPHTIGGPRVICIVEDDEGQG